MKKTKLLIAITLLLSVFAACKKDRLLTYGGANSIYYGYKDPSTNLVDSAEITFGFSPLSVTDTVFKIPVLVTGLASKKDRTYNVLVDTGTTALAGKHFKLPATFVFHANRLQDSLAVTLIRTPDMQTAAVTLRLTLKPSADLQTNVKTLYGVFQTLQVTSFKIKASDMLVDGPYWTNVFSTYFGTFSVKKVQLINQVTGMPLNYITLAWLQDLNFSARIVYYAITTANYLATQKVNGHTVYESDGVTPMTMGAAYQ